ncbi:zinc finger, CCHC-type containing protein [Tanacetum coccineum]
MTRSSLNELFTPYKEPKREFRSSRRHFKTLSLDKLRSLDFNSFSDQKYSEEEVAETMAETMEQYMSKTRADYGSGVARPKIEDKDNFELKGQFLKELRTNTFSGSDHEDANEHIEKVLEIVDLFHIPNITIDQVMLRAFPMSLTGAASRWLRNEPTGSITTWDGLKTKFLNKYCPPARTAKKMEEINNFQQEPDENLYQAWERYKELLMKGAIPSKTAADAKGRDEKKRLDYLKQDLMDVVFDGAFGGVRDEEAVVGEGVVVISSSLDMLTNSCLGRIMVSLIFLEGLDEEAFMEFMDYPTQLATSLFSHSSIMIQRIWLKPLVTTPIQGSKLERLEASQLRDKMKATRVLKVYKRKKD